ncbi:DUF5333 family protein [Tateyamaria sp. SN3-11]|uniref:DUF5333 family protein n=1 Tax=Tateyamaria sp. SN3-11 TaxID=3092147 RepID=UPI0039ECB046
MKLANQFFVAGLVLLAGCSEPTGQSSTSSTVDPVVLEQLYLKAQPFSYASEVAKRCRTIELDPEESVRLKNEFAKLQRELAVSENAAVRALKNNYKQRTQDDLFAFIEENQIVVADQNSWCAAGRRMIAQNDQYGVFLRNRG